MELASDCGRIMGYSEAADHPISNAFPENDMERGLRFAAVEIGRVPRAAELRFRNTCTEGQIDVITRRGQSGVMGEVITASPRRSSRVFHKMRLQAEGRGHNRKKFKETCETVVVNAHGGLLLLKHEVANGEMLVITNPETQEELECRIVYLGEPGDKGQRVGVEFLTPAPRFWGVDFVDAAPAENSSAVN